MPKYRKKPVVIEAWEFSKEWAKPGAVPPDFAEAVCRNNCLHLDTFPGVRPHIHTLEGPHLITLGDYIIRGVKGEFYPCKPDIFAETHEEATDARSQAVPRTPTEGL